MDHPEVSEKIVRVSLHDTLIANLRALLIRGELKPGEKVPEQALCRRFGISRTPMREALKVLASEGVLQLLPNRGAIVAVLREEEVEQHFPVMAALEAVAGETACRRATDSDMARMRAMHDAMLEHYHAGDEVSYLKYGRAIHYALFEIADNAVLTGFYEQILMRVHNVRYVRRKSQDNWDRAVREHQAIIEAFEARDAERVGKLLKAHVEGTVVNIAKESIQRDQPPAAP
ncbi:GntR family transcriptional regulator [Bordetella sp. BOR01]|uniref:GntR family transcriptional regulator n=1 Tax=Bordetella sp. BOR01 TaxID=2854779 RepID=UPI001C438AD8|nr:GntR family transcriptional regulator [Bordetella sp. BOR01]MBV7481992.1 GntR family transcriptional regulator [Bordetella sp. BOR01]